MICISYKKMVSEKTIIVLITIAILLSIASIAVTISTLNEDSIPEIQPQELVIPDTASANVAIIVNEQANPPTP